MYYANENLSRTLYYIFFVENVLYDGCQTIMAVYLTMIRKAAALSRACWPS